MAKLKVIHEQEGDTLQVWFDDPSKEHVCEETGDEIILVKDKEGNVIGFEKLNYSKTASAAEEGVEYSLA